MQSNAPVWFSSGRVIDATPEALEFASGDAPYILESEDYVREWRVAQVPIGAIDYSQSAPDQDGLSERLASIRRAGELSRPIYELLPNGRVKILDGWHRLQVSMERGETEIEALVCSPGSVEVLSEREFYRTYMQHIDIRGRDGSAEKNRASIMRDGFKPAFGNVNALPPYRGGKPANVIDARYSPVAGDTVYLVPKPWWKDGPNGPVVVAGWRPQPHEVVSVTDPARSMYGCYREAAEASGLKLTESEAFRQWFGDSKVVGPDGNPLVLYHGTTTVKDFVKFKAPAYFTSEAEAAQIFGEEAELQGMDDDVVIGSRLIPVYLSIKNPLVFTNFGNFAEWTARDRTRAEKRGYDGVRITMPDNGEQLWLAFRPEQIKFAIGNSGKFDPNSASLADGEDGAGQVDDRPRMKG